jgi:hypothetical protein
VILLTLLVSNAKWLFAAPTDAGSGDDPETRPFLDAYHGGLVEPDENLDIGGDDSTFAQEIVGENGTDDEATEVVDPIKVRQQISESKENQVRKFQSLKSLMLIFHTGCTAVLEPRTGPR